MALKQLPGCQQQVKAAVAATFLLLFVEESSPLGSTFQAIVSVMAVKIQLSSPSGVRLSFSLPGILEQDNTDGG